MKSLILGFLMIAMTGYAFGDGTGKGGDEFRKTAQEYEMKSNKARSSGDTENARIYSRLADIKTDAAKLADKGRWSDIDWTEYNQLNEQLSGKNNSHKNKKYK